MIMEYNRKLILEDGQEYYGYAFGDTDDSVCEICLLYTSRCV